MVASIFKTFSFLKWCPIFDNSVHYSQNTTIHFDYADLWPKIHLILYPSRETWQPKLPYWREKPFRFCTRLYFMVIWLSRRKFWMLLNILCMLILKCGTVYLTSITCTKCTVRYETSLSLQLSLSFFSCHLLLSNVGGGRR